MNPTDIDWVKIRNEYVTGTCGLHSLAAKYRIDRRNLERHSSREGWVAAREEYRKRVSALAEEKAAEKQAEEFAAYIDEARGDFIRDHREIQKKIDETIHYGEAFSPRDLKNLSGLLADLMRVYKDMREEIRAADDGDGATYRIEFVPGDWEEDGGP